MGDVVIDLFFISIVLALLLLWIKEVVIILFLIALISSLLNKKKKIPLYVYAGITVLCSLAYALYSKTTIGIPINLYLKNLIIETYQGGFEHFKYYLIQNMKVFHPYKWLYASVTTSALLAYPRIKRWGSLSEELEQLKKEEKYIDPNAYFPVDYEQNIFVTGSTGSGKTAGSLNFIEHAIKENKFVFAMDGKGDMTDYSVYDSMIKLANKHNRKVYVINQTNSTYTSPYNPFKHANPTQIKDMLLSLSTWSEEHYKGLAGHYWLHMATLMKKADIPMSFESILHYSDPDNLLDLAMVTRIDKLISKREYKMYSKICQGKGGETVLSSKTRFSTIYEGEGKKLFGNEKAFDIEQAYKENAVVIVLLNGFKYSDFARSMGLLVVQDLKNMLGYLTENNIEQRKQDILKDSREGRLNETITEEELNKRDYYQFFFFDEISVYFDDEFVDIVNKTRSLGGNALISTQTIADLDKVSELTRKQLIANCNGFMTLRQNEPEAVNVLTDIMGTKRSYAITRQTDLAGQTGKGTVTSDRDYKVHPDTIKELPSLVGFWYEKNDNTLIKYKTRFVNLEVEKEKQKEIEDIILLTQNVEEYLNTKNYVRSLSEKEKENFLNEIEEKNTENEKTKNNEKQEEEIDVVEEQEENKEKTIRM